MTFPKKFTKISPWIGYELMLAGLFSKVAADSAGL